MNTKTKTKTINLFFIIILMISCLAISSEQQKPKRAMMDLNAQFSASSSAGAHWARPRLDSRSGIHNVGGMGDSEQWWQVSHPKKGGYYEVSAMLLMKRGDSAWYLPRYITHVQFKYSQDGGETWIDHEKGRWFETGAKPNDSLKKINEFKIDPPMIGNAFRVYINKAHKIGAEIQGRFDLMVKETTLSDSEKRKPNLQRAIIDHLAKTRMSTTNGWTNYRLDSTLGFHDSADKLETWVEAALPGKIYYEAKAMSLMKNAHIATQPRIINAVRFQYSRDNGISWEEHANSKWYDTGAELNDTKDTVRNIKIDPPMIGNAFRFITDKDHKTGVNIAGRFDFWIVKSNKVFPKDTRKRAMMDLKALFDASNFINEHWKNPRLDGRAAVHCHAGQGDWDQWWQVNHPKKGIYEASAMLLKKRGDGGAAWPRILTAVQFKYSQDNGQTWIDHENGKWFPTGQHINDDINTVRIINIDPPMIGNAFRVYINKKHKTAGDVHSRFDLLVNERSIISDSEKKKPNLQRAIIDHLAKTRMSTTNGWTNYRLDSTLGFHDRADKLETWVEAALPGKIYYEAKAMSLMKNAHIATQPRIINAVRFQYSRDNGITWEEHANSKWYDTGAELNDNIDTVRYIKIDPPMIGNAFRFITDKDHKTGVNIAGRFDFWIVKSNKVFPKDTRKRAMMDLKAQFTASSYLNNQWRNPRLDSKTGILNASGEGDQEQWWEVKKSGQGYYETNFLLLKKRGDGGHVWPRIITAVQFKYSQDNGVTWIDHESGKWFPTGQHITDDLNTVRKIKIDPPMIGNAFRVYINKENKSSTDIQGRFDFLVKEKDTLLDSEKKKPNLQRAFIDHLAKFRASSSAGAGWEKPRLDSKTGIHSRGGHGDYEQWWEANLTGKHYYQVRAMSLMKRGDGTNGNLPRIITSVKFQYSYDHGKNWDDHEDGKWYDTGAELNDTKDTVRKFNIDPPMIGNAFRVIINKEHKTGPEIQGRFDLWLIKSDKEYKYDTKRAMQDLKAVFTASSFLNDHWKQPRLDSKSGIHSKGGQGDWDQWWQVNHPGQGYYEASAMLLGKRGDGASHLPNILTGVSFKYSQDNGRTWIDYQSGKWFDTGMQKHDYKDTIRKIKIDPPMIGNAFRVYMDKHHKTAGDVMARFDLLVKEKRTLLTTEKRKPNLQRAIIDHQSTWASSSTNGWNNPRLDSITGFHNAGGQGDLQQWWEIKTPPGRGNYECGAMSLMKRGDGNGHLPRIITAVRFQYSRDNGVHWNNHQNGKWYATGAKINDNIDTIRKFKIVPPMFGNAFRVIIDKEHKTGPEIAGRFDLWVIKSDKVFKIKTKRAMMDLKATFTASSYFNSQWSKPRLDSKTGILNASGEGNQEQWWQVNHPRHGYYEASALLLKKRGDGGHVWPRIITHVQFKYSQDGGVTWIDYLAGKWIETGQHRADNLNTVRKIEINPPMIGNAFRVYIDKKHKISTDIQGRFDFLVQEKGELLASEKKHPQLQRLFIDHLATWKASSTNGWNNPRLDSVTGFHNAGGQGDKEQWWQVNTHKQVYEVRKMSLMKRGDGKNGNLPRIIDAVRFQYSFDDGKTWKDHDNGSWFKTGAELNDTVDTIRTFKINPPIHGNAFRIYIDKEHKTGPEIAGRFDLWAINSAEQLLEIKEREQKEYDEKIRREREKEAEKDAEDRERKALEREREKERKREAARKAQKDKEKQKYAEEERIRKERAERAKKESEREDEEERERELERKRQIQRDAEERQEREKRRKKRLEREKQRLRELEEKAKKERLREIEEEKELELIKEKERKILRKIEEERERERQKRKELADKKRKQTIQEENDRELAKERQRIKEMEEEEERLIQKYKGATTEAERLRRKKRQEELERLRKWLLELEKRAKNPNYKGSDDFDYTYETSYEKRPTDVTMSMKPLVGNGFYQGPSEILIQPKKNLRNPFKRFVVVQESIAEC